VGNFDANCGYECTLDGLVREGRGTRGTDYDADVMPHDPDGFPLEGGFERYMVPDHVWEAAKGEGVAVYRLSRGPAGSAAVPWGFQGGLPINEPDARCRRVCGAAWEPGGTWRSGDRGSLALHRRRPVPLHR